MPFLVLVLRCHFGQQRLDRNLKPASSQAHGTQLYLDFAPKIADIYFEAVYPIAQYGLLATLHVASSSPATQPSLFRS